MAEKVVKLAKAQITGYEDDYILETISRTGDFYEKALLDAWTPLLGNPKVIMDVGANLGNHTVFWATTLPDVETIVSFEPYPANYACLQKNIEDNHLGCVKALPLAVGDRCSTAAVVSFDPENYGATTLQYADENQTGETMQVVTLDSAAEKLDLKRIDFVKIDTEGFELRVLRGMKGVIESSRPVLWIEVGEDTVIDVLNFLKPYHYELARMEGANLLFLPPESADITKITSAEILRSNMHELNRANIYYQNYEKAKKWVQAKDVRISELQKNTQDQKEKIAGLQEKTKELSVQRNELEKKHTALMQESDQQKARIEELESLLQQSYTQLCDEERFLVGVKQQMQQLSSKLQVANAKNREYELKLNKVYGTWYGRMALKAYKVLKRIKRIIFH